MMRGHDLFGLTEVLVRAIGAGALRGAKARRRT